MKFWNDFAEKHPKAAKWIREGGLFVIVSNLITVMKYFILQGLPYFPCPPAAAKQILLSLHLHLCQGRPLRRNTMPP